MSDQRFFDGWANIVTPPAAAAWAERVGPRHAATKVFDRLAAIEAMPMSGMVAQLDANAIDRAMIVAPGDVSPWEDHGRFLSHVATEIAPYGDRFRFGGGVNFEDRDRGVEQLRRAATEHGMAALYVVPSMVGKPADDPHFDPYWEACEELGVVAVVVVGIPGGPVPAKHQRPLTLDEVCLRFPELEVVAAHIGHPWQTETIAFARRHPRLSIMTCGWAPKRYPREIVEFAAGRGREKVIFATDYPLLSFERCTTEALELPLDAAARQAVFHDNGLRVFGFDRK